MDLVGKTAKEGEVDNFYQEVVQAVLLFGAETWVLLESMSRKL